MERIMGAIIPNRLGGAKAFRGTNETGMQRYGAKSALGALTIFQVII